MATNAEILQQARDLILYPENWTYGRLKHGNKYCAVGAVREAELILCGRDYRNPYVGNAYASPIVQLLNQAVAKVFPDKFCYVDHRTQEKVGDVVHVNDAIKNGDLPRYMVIEVHNNVLEVFDQAIKDSKES